MKIMPHPHPFVYHHLTTPGKQRRITPKKKSNIPTLSPLPYLPYCLLLYHTPLPPFAFTTYLTYPYPYSYSYPCTQSFYVEDLQLDMDWTYG